MRRHRKYAGRFSIRVPEEVLLWYDKQAQRGISTRSQLIRAKIMRPYQDAMKKAEERKKIVAP